MSLDAKPRERKGRGTRRLLLLALACMGLTLTVAAPAAVGTARATGKPVIGKPVATPPQPAAGERFTISFRVTRSDTGARLTRGRMICDPSVAGRLIRHAESFKGGTARLSFVVPAKAAGKLLKVKVTIRTGAQSATKVAAFRVRGAQTMSVSIGDSSVAEGSSGTTSFAFPVTLSAPASRTVSVGYATADQTALAPSDYAGASGTLTFTAGERVKTIQIGVVGDLAIERDEWFTVTISSPVNATIANAAATGTITNDDAVSPGGYNGTTQNGKIIFIWVGRTAKTLTGVRVIALPCPCDGPVRVTGGQNLRDNTYPISAEGTFVAEGSWNGSVMQGVFEVTHWDIKVTGAFDTTTSATATVIANYELNYKGTHVKCSSGEVRWSATLQS